MPNNPDDMVIQNPSFHAFDAATGAIEWENNQANTFGPTSVSGGAVFNGVGDILPAALRVYDAGTGAPLASFKADGAVNSGAAIVGKTIYFGAGNSFNGIGGAVFAYRLP
jgi:outer membrane protein assembly factor BamB